LSKILPSYKISWFFTGFTINENVPGEDGGAILASRWSFKPLKRREAIKRAEKIKKFYANPKQ